MQARLMTWFAQQSYCLSDDALKSIKFLGDERQTTIKNVRIVIDKCRNSTNSEIVCASQSEIEDFLNTILLSVMTKRKKYDPNIYDSNSVQDYWQFDEFMFDARKSQTVEFRFKRESLQSDHQFYSLGLYQETVDFFTVGQNIRKKESWSDINGVFSLVWALDSSETLHTRSIYSPLDFLGDVGGLLDAVYWIGLLITAVIQFFTGGTLNQYLVHSVFTTDNSRKLANKSWKTKLCSVTLRKPFIVNESLVQRLFGDRRIKNAKKIAQASIEKELDIVRFVKTQKVLKMALEVLFTKDQMVLIKHNKHLNLRRRYKEAKQENSSDDSQLLNLEPTPELRKLYQQTQHQPTVRKRQMGINVSTFKQTAQEAPQMKSQRHQLSKVLVESRIPNKVKKSIGK